MLSLVNMSELLRTYIGNLLNPFNQHSNSHEYWSPCFLEELSCWKNLFKDLSIFTCGVHFVNSHNLLYWLCNDISRRNLKGFKGIITHFSVVILISISCPEAAILLVSTKDHLTLGYPRGRENMCSHRSRMFQSLEIKVYTEWITTKPEEGLPTSDIGHRTSQIGASDIRHRTSDIRHQTSDIGHRTSNIGTSDIGH